MTRHELIVNLAQKAGDEALKYFRVGIDGWDKAGGLSDFYTEADTASEQLILEEYGRVFPNDRVLSEERGPVGQWSENLLVVDPLDGSIPFIQGLAGWVVSIGLLKNFEAESGVICIPVEGELISTERGKGTSTKHHGTNISIQREIKPIKAVVHVDYSKNRNRGEVAATTGRLIEKVRYPLTFGSCGYAIGMLLLGRVHAVIHPAPDIYDWAGIDVLVREAGGVISNFQGESIDRSKNNNSLIAACSVNLWEYLVSELRRY